MFAAAARWCVDALLRRPLGRIAQSDRAKIVFKRYLSLPTLQSRYEDFLRRQWAERERFWKQH